MYTEKNQSDPEEFIMILINANRANLYSVTKCGS